MNGLKNSQIWLECRRVGNHRKCLLQGSINPQSEVVWNSFHRFNQPCVWYNRPPFTCVSFRGLTALNKLLYKSTVRGFVRIQVQISYELGRKAIEISVEACQSGLTIRLWLTALCTKLVGPTSGRAERPRILGRMVTDCKMIELESLVCSNSSSETICDSCGWCWNSFFPSRSFRNLVTTLE